MLRTSLSTAKSSVPLINWQKRCATFGQVIVGERPTSAFEDRKKKWTSKNHIYALYKERYLDKLPSSIANKSKPIPLKKRRWVQPANLTPEKQREDALENPKPVKHIREGQQIFIDKLFEASEKNLVSTVLDYYLKINLKHCDARVYTAVFKACESDGGFLGEAMQVYHDMKARKMALNTSQFTSLVKCAAAAEHLPKAIYIVKEFLTRPKKSPIISNLNKLLEMFEVVMKLAIKLNRPDRAMLMYIEANKKQVYSTRPDASLFYNNRLPLVYVEELLAGESKERVYEVHRSMVRSRSPNFQGEKSQENDESNIVIEVIPSDAGEADYYAGLRVSSRADVDPYGPLYFDLHRTVHASAYNNPSRHLTQSGYELPVATKSVHFTFDGYSVEPTVNMLNDREWQDNYLRIVKDVLEYVDLDAEGKERHQLQTMFGIMNSRVKCAKKEHIPFVKKVYDDFIDRYFYCTEDLEVQALKRELIYDLADLSRKVQVNRNWIPIIVGVDTKPFFPTSIGFDLLTKERVDEAKREYFDSILDEEGRAIIKSELSHKIQLRWFDLDNNQIVDGLVY